MKYMELNGDKETQRPNVPKAEKQAQQLFARFTGMKCSINTQEKVSKKTIFLSNFPISWLDTITTPVHPKPFL